MNLSKFKKSRIVRTACFPLVNAIRYLRLLTYPHSKDAAFLRTQRGLHQGRRCFIIGNGPSLCCEDLELLKDEYCFAANKIYQIFPQTGWRPSCYLCADSHVFSECREEIAALDLPMILLHKEAQKYHTQKKNPHVTYINNFYPFLIDRYKRVRGITVSPDVSHHFNCGETVTFLSIQLALYMGFTEIYLLGVDHNYSRKITAQGKLILDPSVKDYFGDVKTQDYNIQSIDTSTAAYEAAYAYCNARQIRIQNATRGGKLQVFPRTTLETILGQPPAAFASAVPLPYSFTSSPLSFPQSFLNY